MLTRRNIKQADLWDLGYFEPTSYSSFNLRNQISAYIRDYVRVSDFYSWYKPRSIHHYQAKRYNPDTYLTTFTFRTPKNNADIHNEETQRGGVRNWHYDVKDMDSDRPTNCYLVLWSNTEPTELKRRYGKVVYTVPAGHVIIVENDKWVHRMPKIKKADLKKRYFIRSFLFLG